MQCTLIYEMKQFFSKLGVSFIFEQVPVLGNSCNVTIATTVSDVSRGPAQKNTLQLYTYLQ